MTKRIVFYLFLALASFLFLKSAYAQTGETIWRVYSYGQWWESPLASGVCSNVIQKMEESTNADPNSANVYDYSFTHLSAVYNGRATCIGSYTVANRKDGKVFTSESNVNLVNIESVTCSGATPKYSYVKHACAAVEDPPTCQAGKSGSGRWQAGTNDTSAATNGGCVAGCQVQMTGVQSCWGPASGICTTGQCSCVFSYTTTGQTCTAGEGSPGTVPEPNPPQPRKDVPPIKPPPGKSCPAGTVQAGVDSAGTPICMGTGTDPKNAPPPPPKIESEKTEQKPDGSTVTTKTEVTQNSDGSTTTKTTTVTKGPDGSTKTDVTMDTSNTPTGEKGKDESAKDNEKYDLCKQNPMLTICRNSSVSGACGEVTCQGDAIQCATLRAAAAMECRTKKQEEDFLKRPEIATGQQILDGNDPMKGAIDAALKGETVDFGSQNLDQSGFVGGGSCLAPRTFTLLGHSVTVSFDSMCSNIQPLRYAILACAFIFAYLIVSRAALEA